MAALHDTLNPWLGEPRYKQSQERATFKYRFQSEDTPPLPPRLKMEIHTGEHFSVEGFQQIPFEVTSRWITTTQTRTISSQVSDKA